MVDAQRQRINPNMHVGTMGWSYSFWKGKFYPQKLASKDYLSYYARQFSSVEIDSTFYRIPSVQTITTWTQQVPSGFLFSLKFPQIITHLKMLKDCQEETKVFIKHATLLGTKLGVFLLQLPPMFRQIHLPFLKVFIESLPKGHRYAVEVRNNSLLNDDLYKLLKDNNVALVWVDTPSMSKTKEITADFVYVRWEGDRKTVQGTKGKIETDRTGNIKTWAVQLKPIIGKGSEVFGYFSKYYSGYPPVDIDIFLKQVLNLN